jgi:hypothetical protein
MNQALADLPIFKLQSGSSNAPASGALASALSLTISKCLFPSKKLKEIIKIPNLKHKLSLWNIYPLYTFKQ